MFEYVCKDCHIEELLIEVVPKKACPCCQMLMEVIESEGIE